MNTCTTILSLAIVHITSLITPGPDLLIVTRYSILKSKAAGVMAALGVTTGNAVHILYSLFIAQTLSNENQFVLTALKLCGASYLMWMGLKAILTADKADTSAIDRKSGQKLENLYSFISGLSSSLFNAKAALYFISIVPQFITAIQPPYINYILFVEFIIISLGWFLFIALNASSNKVKALLTRHIIKIEKITGCILIAFSLSIIIPLLKGSI